MICRFLPLALALSFATGVVVLEAQVVRAEEPAGKVVRMAFVATVSAPSISPGYTVDFWERLRELGWTKGENILVEERWANGYVDRMPALFAEVVARKIDVLVTATDPGAIAAKKATSTIPIVAVALGDPVGAGVSASLARPGGNLTGLSVLSGEGLPGKRLELLREMLPRGAAVAVLWNPNFTTSRVQVNQLEKQAVAHGIKLRPIELRSWEDLEKAFSRAHAQAKGIIVLGDPLLYSDRRRVVSLAARSRIPAIYPALDYVSDGGLMAYGPDYRVMYRRAAEYVDKILKGTKPADLPIEQSTQYKLVVNLKTAKALGITIPESILVRADEVIR